ncbi:basic blue protein-like [Henckelia pumila]|uniref:basic blue protein-like n=1 Tax=Henckelia pumila TaxID=405737 RepID=UPI003C6E5932
MGEGRRSALLILAVVVMVLTAEATTYTVGDSGGWSYFVSGWPQGKHFVAGDSLVFNYNPSFHNVVKVSGGGYNGCTTPSGSKVYQSGKDRITLAKGENYFICSIPGHCEAMMKIAVNAA